MSVFDSFLTQRSVSDGRKKAMPVIIASLLSALISSTSGAISKFTKLGTKEINISYGASMLFLATILLLADQKTVIIKVQIKSSLIAVLNGSLFIGSSLSLFFAAFETLTYGDIVSVQITSLFLTSVIIETIQLKVSPPKLKWLAAIFSFMGLVMFSFSQPNFSQNYSEKGLKTFLGVFYAFLSGVSMSIFYLNIQFMKHVPVSLHYFACALGSFVPPVVRFIVYSPVSSVCDVSMRSMAASACLVWPLAPLNGILASQMSLPSIFAVLRLFNIVFSYILQVLFLHESLSLFSMLGVVGITLGVSTQVMSMYSHVVFPKKSNRTNETQDEDGDRNNNNKVLLTEVLTAKQTFNVNC